MQLEKAKSAFGAKGSLIHDADGDLFFRIYSSPDNFTDYLVLASEMEIIIADSFTMLKTSESGTETLDYSDDVLGK